MNNFKILSFYAFINLKDLSKSKKIDKLIIHRKINSLIKSEFSEGLHALQIKIKN